MKRGFPAFAHTGSRLAPYLRYSFATISALALHSAGLFCVVALLAHWAPADALGHYVLGYAISAPVFVFLNARQRIVLVNHTGSEDPTWRFVASRLRSTGLGLISLWALSLCLWGQSAPEKATVIVLVATVKAAESVGDIAFGGLQKAGALNITLKLIALRALLTVAAACLVVPLTGNALAITFVLAIIWAGISLLGLWQLSRRIRWQGLAAETTSSLLSAIANPLGLISLTGSMAYYTPRYILNLEAGDAAMGYFGALSYFGLIMLMAGNATGDALVPLLTQKHKNALVSPGYRNALWQLYGVLLCVGGLGIALLLLFGAPLLRFLLGQSYEDFAPLTAMLLAASTLTALINCQAHALAALNVHQAQLRGALLSFAALLAASLVWVPRFGMTGAAMAELLYALLYLLFMEHLMKKVLRSSARVTNP